MNIPFNIPHVTGDEIKYIQAAINNNQLSGNGKLTHMCQDFLETKFGFRKCLLTTSCTDALEMCAILCDLKPNDEVIIPSFTFVSTALAFVRVGAKIIFADSSAENPNINAEQIEKLLTQKTKVIVVVHYAGVSCDMEAIMNLAHKYNLIVVEDAAQAIDSYYKGVPLGKIGNLAAMSFHETKNISSGEGGCLIINDERFIKRSEIIWEKGTNRAEFFRGEVNKYGWVDTGSSFLPSEVTAAFLLAQLEHLDEIQRRRKELWIRYFKMLFPLFNSGKLIPPSIPEYASNNAHMFYILCKDISERTKLINMLKTYGISSTFHYLPLHSSPFYKNKHDGRSLPHTDFYANTLLRLPLFYDLTFENVQYICELLLKHV